MVFSWIRIKSTRLIAAAGLSDKKLRRYIRQIWEKILSMLNPEIANKADRSKSYLDDPLLGDTEFVVNDRNGETIASLLEKNIQKIHISGKSLWPDFGQHLDVMLD